MNYKNYQKARNAAWKILLDMNIQTLPVDPAKILTQLGISLGTYRSNDKLIQRYHLEEIAKTSSALTVYKLGTIRVLYDDTEPKERIRFSIAHELGHIICGHVSSGKVTLRNKEPSKGDNSIETEANVFAARLLAPACVFHEMQIFESEKISEICGISLQAASYRAERLQLLEERDKQFRQQRGYGCYYQSPLERKLLEQFIEFINHQKENFHPE